jgi:membrane associated rhomboid family serine protease
MAWQTILLINAAEQLLRREPGLSSLVGLSEAPRLLPDTEDSFFSGDALERYSPWSPYLSASFCHMSRSHCVNNMIMLAAVGPQLEERLGPLPLIGLYCGCGAAGWALTNALTKRQCNNVDPEGGLWECAGKFQQSAGASPATYGLCTAAACLLRPELAVGPCASMDLSTACLSCSPSFLSTTAAVYILPRLCDHSSSLSEKAASLLFTDLPCLCFGAWLANTTVGPGAAVSEPQSASVTAASFLTAYHVKTLSKTVVSQGRNLLKSAGQGGADHPCHFAGAVVGLLAAVAILAVEQEELQHEKAVGASLAYLALRLFTNI